MEEQYTETCGIVNDGCVCAVKWCVSMLEELNENHLLDAPIPVETDSQGLFDWISNPKLEVFVYNIISNIPRYNGRNWQDVILHNLSFEISFGSKIPDLRCINKDRRRICTLKRYIVVEGNGIFYLLNKIRKPSPRIYQLLYLMWLLKVSLESKIKPRCLPPCPKSALLQKS
ncbi:hypothetical protein AVEN_80662-1 [Araneus ventricosus]|uniref:Uncharacterized protein n=1 Tax=Araneus ventricosus TaxID=182803 RepID=A0A4Y2TWB9_ARAVE|nr:hypothetical protein AVEN_80662-1 [Araneus ventricosus]